MKQTLLTTLNDTTIDRTLLMLLLNLNKFLL